MPDQPHGNSKKSRKPHHLYEIWDSEDNDVYKYGISGDPLNADGSSPRANEQVNLFNKVVKMVRFFARILLVGISGREKASELEDQYIEEYQKKHGKKPRGNE